MTIYIVTLSCSSSIFFSILSFLQSFLRTVVNQSNSWCVCVCVYLILSSEHGIKKENWEIVIWTSWMSPVNSLLLVQISVVSCLMKDNYGDIYISKHS